MKSIIIFNTYTSSKTQTRKIPEYEMFEYDLCPHAVVHYDLWEMYNNENT